MITAIVIATVFMLLAGDYLYTYQSICYLENHGPMFTRTDWNSLNASWRSLRGLSLVLILYTICVCGLYAGNADLY